MVSLIRPSRPQAPPLTRSAVLDDQARVIRVLGAPGTGKTTLAVEIAVDRVRRGEVEADRVLLLTPDRLAAARLRDAVTAGLATTTSQPLARTHQALGFSILRREQALREAPTPRLLTGPEQDAILKELLAGHASGAVPAPPWPAAVAAALGTRGFRAELRDLLMRAVEHGLGPSELRALGCEHGIPAWEAAAHVLAEYDEVTAFSRPGAYDPAWILSAAADLLEEDPDARARVHADIGLLVVDDAQELTSSAARLLGLVASPTCTVVLLGDPDTTVQGFRGADPTTFALRWNELFAEADRSEHVLLEDHRRGPRLQAVSRRVVSHIGTVGSVQHRRPRPAAGAPTGRVDVHVLRSPAQEGLLVASTLRRAHLEDGIAYADMAVVVRGSARLTTLRRSVRAAGVPVASASAELPLREEPVVRALLVLLKAVVARARGVVPAMSADDAQLLLTSPLAALDAVGLRRLRRALRAAGLAPAHDGDLLATALLDLDALTAVRAGRLGASGALAVARALAAGVDAAHLDEDGRWAAGVDAELLLWECWSALGLAAPWRRTALDGGPAGARADHLLDAVLALHEAAAGFADRLPGAGPEAFLAEILGQDVPADSLVRRAPDTDAVALLTPARAAGLEWRLVVVAGVQDGTWPDLRLRGSLLGSERLVDLLHGRADTPGAALRAVRHDETRLFHVATSRARERLVVTAVSDEDDAPSPFLDLVDPHPAGPRPFTDAPHAMTLSGLVGQARHLLVGADGSVAAAPAAVLAWLADEGVPGASPDDWWSRREVTTSEPLLGPEDSVRVSPSRVEQFHECPLQWVLVAHGGEALTVASAALGTLVHDIAATHADAGEQALLDELDRRLPELELGDTLAGRVTRDRARQMMRRLAAYVDAARREGWEPVGTEIGVRVAIGRADVVGRLDRLERRGDEVRVVDLKTGTSAPSQARTARNAQLGVYQAAVEAGALDDIAPGARSGGALLVHVGTTAKTPTLRTQGPPRTDPDDPHWARTLVESAAEGMAAATFPAVVNDGCRFCPVSTVCPAIVVEEDR